MTAHHTPSQPTAWVFLAHLRTGGTIVSSNDCSPEEIAAAQKLRRFHVDADGFGYVFRPARRSSRPVARVTIIQEHLRANHQIRTDASKDGRTVDPKELLAPIRVQHGNFVCYTHEVTLPGVTRIVHALGSNHPRGPRCWVESDHPAIFTAVDCPDACGE